MSDVEIGRPEGRTQYSDKPMEIWLFLPEVGVS